MDCRTLQGEQGRDWIDADASVEGPVVRLKPHGDPAVGSNIGLALVQNVKFSEGTLEIDLRGAGKQEASFLGVAFGVADAKTFEAVYFRPFRFADDGPDARSHAGQYVAWPEYTWEKLRKDKPGGYEAAIQPVPDPTGWFHARIEVTKQKVSVSIDGSTRPCLVGRSAGASRRRLGQHARRRLRKARAVARPSAAQSDRSFCTCVERGQADIRRDVLTPRTRRGVSAPRSNISAWPHCAIDFGSRGASGSRAD